MDGQGTPHLRGLPRHLANLPPHLTVWEGSAGRGFVDRSTLTGAGLLIITTKAGLNFLQQL